MRNLISIIYVYYNTPKDIVDSIRSIPLAIDNLGYEIIIVNNSSPAALPKSITKSNSIRVIDNGTNIGYGRAMNKGARIAKGEYLLLANPDIIFLENAIKKMVLKMEKTPEVGIIGPQMLDKSRKIVKIGNSMPFIPGALFVFSFLGKVFPHNPYSKKYFLDTFDRTEEKEIDVICGACLLIKKSLFDLILGFDKRFFMYFEEADLCYRIRKKGYKVLYYPDAKIVHYFGRSTSDEKWIKKIFEQSRFRFFEKYHGLILATIAETFLRFSSFSRSLYKKL